MRSPTLKSLLMPNLWSIIAIALVFTSTIAARSNPAPLAGPTATTTTISYQGTLATAAGQPLNAAAAMTFRLYAAPAGGSPLWTESRSGANAVPVADGLFNVLLGSVTPIDVGLFGQDLWLGVSVGGDPEMTPREKLGSVPFAAVAGTVPDGSITQKKAPRLVLGPEDNTRVAHGQAMVSKIAGTDRGNVSIPLSQYGFTQTPTALCALAGGGGFEWSCHVEYETPSTFTIWVVKRVGDQNWTQVPVRWLAIGN